MIIHHNQSSLLHEWLHNISDFMIEKQEFNQPFCMSILSIIFLALSLIALIAFLALQVVNSQLTLFSMANSQYLQGYTDIDTATVCNAGTVSSVLSYSCTKYKNHMVYLAITNVLAIVTILIQLVSLGFLIALTVNLNRKTHKCMCQRKTQKTVFGLLSVGLAFSSSLMAYHISFYMNFEALTGFSTNISNYRSSFFISLISSSGGAIFMLLNYILLFQVKTEEYIDHKYDAANGNDTLMNTAGDMNEQEMMQMMQQKKLMGHDGDNPMDYKDYLRKKNKKAAKSDSKIQEVEPSHQEAGEEVKEKKLYGGYARARPKLPTATVDRKNTYPKLQKPRIVPKELLRPKPEVSDLLREVKYDSINKAQQNAGEMEMNVSVLPDQNAERRKQNVDKENLDGTYLQIALNPKKEPEMVTVRRNTNVASQQEMSVMDPTHLHIFQRKMHVAQHLRLIERKERL